MLITKTRLKVVISNELISSIYVVKRILIRKMIIIREEVKRKRRSFNMYVMRIIIYLSYYLSVYVMRILTIILKKSCENYSYFYFLYNKFVVLCNNKQIIINLFLFKYEKR